MLLKKKLSECVFAANNGLPLPMPHPYAPEYWSEDKVWAKTFQAMYDFAQRDNIEYKDEFVAAHPQLFNNQKQPLTQDEFGEFSEEAFRSICNRVNMERIHRDLELVKDSEEQNRKMLLNLMQPFGRK